MGANWGQGAQGAAGGAAAGAAFGPWGAAIGGGIGGAMGLLSGSSQQRMPGFDRRGASLLDQIRQTNEDRHALQLGPTERSAGGTEFRGGQQQLVRQLQDQAAGRGPSLASMQANSVAQRSLAQQQALAAGAAPGNEAMAARQAAMNAGNTMQDLAGTSAQARMAEQMQARAQLGGLLGQARGQDIGNEQYNASAGNNMNLAQAQMSMDQRRMNDARNMGLRQLELQNAGSQMSGSQPNTVGTQIMSGGANMLAMYGTNGWGGGQGGGGYALNQQSQNALNGMG